MFVYPKIKLKELLKVCLCYCFKPFSVQELKNRLNIFFPGKEIIFTDSGRSAFRAIIEKFNLQGSEIIFPAYICDIFFDIFRRYDIKPIFIDADIKTAGLEVAEIGRRVTPGTKAIFICHTYGLAENMDEAVDICKKYNLLLIEDCAHAFLGYADLRGQLRGFERKSAYLGNFGQAAIFSFPKVMPVFGGGMAVWDKKFGSYNLPRGFFNWKFLIGFLKNIEAVSRLYYAILRRNFPPPSQSSPSFKEGEEGGGGGHPQSSFLFRESEKGKGGRLFWSNIVLKYFSCLLRDYERMLENKIELGRLYQEKIDNLFFERARHEVSRESRSITSPETPIDSSRQVPMVSPSRILDEVGTRTIKNNSFTFFTVLLPEELAVKRDEIIKKLAKKNIFCERIWHNPIITRPEVVREYNINLNDFPNAVSISKRVINLPLQGYFKEKDVEKIAGEFLKIVRDTNRYL